MRRREAAGSERSGRGGPGGGGRAGFLSAWAPVTYPTLGLDKCTFISHGLEAARPRPRRQPGWDTGPRTVFSCVLTEGQGPSGSLYKDASLSSWAPPSRPHRLLTPPRGLRRQHVTSGTHPSRRSPGHRPLAAERVALACGFWAFARLVLCVKAKTGHLVTHALLSFSLCCRTRVLWVLKAQTKCFLMISCLFT